MILVLDVGNSNIKAGLFQDGKLEASLRIATNAKGTPDEYGCQLTAAIQHIQSSAAAIEGIIISSVVPQMNDILSQMCARFFYGKKPLMVSSQLNLGIGIRYDDPTKLGADRICNAVAAYRIYGGPVVVVDFGTATNFIVVDCNGDILGGLICPGLILSANALVRKAAQLSQVKFDLPEKIIATNTQDGICSGVIHGYIGQVDYIIEQIEKELKYSVRTIATGGMCGLIAQGTQRIDVVHPALTLYGLDYIYRMNAFCSAKQKLRLVGS